MSESVIPPSADTRRLVEAHFGAPVSRSGANAGAPPCGWCGLHEAHAPLCDRPGQAEAALGVGDFLALGVFNPIG